MPIYPRGARGAAGASATLSSATPQALGVAAAGTSGDASRADHVHSTPMTAMGDLLVGGASGAPTRLPAGPEGEVLQVIGGEPAWGPAVSLSGATPQPIGTATAGVATDAARADHVHALSTTTTYDFSSSTGVTLENGSVGGTAAVTGGELVLTCPATPAARHYSTSVEAPRGVISVPTNLGRGAVRWRARARLVSIATGMTAYFLACTSGGSLSRRGFYINADGSFRPEDNIGLSGYGSGAGSSFPTNGTGWCEIEYDGQRGYFRYGTGSGTAVPSTWTDFTSADLGSNRLVEIRLVGAANTAPGVTSVVKWDDCSFEVLP